VTETKKRAKKTVKTKRAVGRPRTFQSVAQMQAAIDAYFVTTPQEELTVTGLALALGLTSRQALLNYEGREEFVDAVKEAKLRVENDYELGLRRHGRAGEIFGLKNFGWKDVQSIDPGAGAKGLIFVFAAGQNADRTENAEAN
jgi:hypothetical protein